MLDLLTTITASEKRKRILLKIRESGPQSLDDIKSELSVPTTSIIPQIRILEEHGLIRKEQNKWTLSQLGLIISEKLFYLVRITDMLDKNQHYWYTHAIEALPPEFIKRISDLGNYTITSSDTIHTFIPKNIFHERMEKTLFFRGMSATIHPDHLFLYLRLARAGRDISHITTQKAYDTLLTSYPAEMKELLELRSDGFIISPIDFGWECVIFDDLLILSLFLKSGIVDPNCDLISADESALKWGYDLYYFYASKSSSC